MFVIVRCDSLTATESVGYRQFTVQLPEAVIRQLDRMCKSTGSKRAAMIEKLIKEKSLASRMKLLNQAD